MKLFNVKQAWQKNDIPYLIIQLSCIGIVLLSGYGWIVHLFFKSFERSGTFGDTFGALNALFSGLAFAGIILSLRVQHEELKLQREEMELQRKEMTKQAKELKGQHEEIEKQRKLSENYAFERFFILLFNEVKESKSKVIIHNYHLDSHTVSKANGLYEKWNKCEFIQSTKENDIFFTNEIEIFSRKFEKLFSYIQKCNDENNKNEYYDIIINDLDQKEKNYHFCILYFIHKAI